jgi:hypothetical protein
MKTYLFVIVVSVTILLRSLGSSCRASTVIFDAFDQGGFDIEYPNASTTNERVSLPFADYRLSAYHLMSSQTQHYSRKLDSVAGNLSFSITGTASDASFPLGMELIYTSFQPQNIRGFSEFVLGFSQMSGAGDLYIITGLPDTYQTVTHLGLDGAGEYHYPTSSVWEELNHPLDSYTLLSFVFASRSSTFSFTLDEIRLVPEPGTPLLVLGAGLWCLRRRRAKRSRST